MKPKAYYLRNMAILMPVGVMAGGMLKYVLSNRVAAIVALASMAITIAVSGVPAVTRWISSHRSLAFVVAGVAYVTGLMHVVRFWMNVVGG